MPRGGHENKAKRRERATEGKRGLPLVVAVQRRSIVGGGGAERGERVAAGE